jgi:hypothetical protein
MNSTEKINSTNSSKAGDPQKAQTRQTEDREKYDMKNTFNMKFII